MSDIPFVDLRLFFKTQKVNPEWFQDVAEATLHEPGVTSDPGTTLSYLEHVQQHSRRRRSMNPYLRAPPVQKTPEPVSPVRSRTVVGSEGAGGSVLPNIQEDLHKVASGSVDDSSTVRVAPQQYYTPTQWSHSPSFVEGVGVQSPTSLAGPVIVSPTDVPTHSVELPV